MRLNRLKHPFIGCFYLHILPLGNLRRSHIDAEACTGDIEDDERCSWEFRR